MTSREPRAPGARGRRASSAPAHTLRAGLAAICLLALAASLLSPYQPEATRARLRRFQSALAGQPGDRAEAMGFWFDPDYLAFLDEVGRRVPRAATVAVLVPARPDLYKYQANYRLAPRRVVEERWLEEADIVATYKSEIGRGPGGEAIPGGLLWKRHTDPR